MAVLQNKQNLFDVSLQNFGTLDNIVKLSNDNSLSISDQLTAGTELVIDNEGFGEEEIKAEIADKSISYNNYYEAFSYITVDTTLITADTTLITADAK
jgi:hypothetical protein